MTKPSWNQCDNQLTPKSGRVTKRLWVPKRLMRHQPLKKQNSELTREYVAEYHPALLDNLLLATNEFQSAAKKFVAFVELEQLAEELDSPLSERLIASKARFTHDYQIFPSRRMDAKEKPTVVAVLRLMVDDDANFRLAKEREAVILAREAEKSEHGTNDGQPNSTVQKQLEPQKKKKTGLGRRIYGNIMKREGSVIKIRVTCRLGTLEAMKDQALKLYVDINTVAQKFQLQAIDHICNKEYIQKKLAFDATRPLESPLLISESSPSRSPSIIWLDDEVDAKSTTSTSSSVICLDDLPPENPPTPPFLNAALFQAAVKPRLTNTSGLNEEQLQAFKKITLNNTKNTFMLFGPPGTGKTLTLVKAIVELVKSGGRVLVCTPSNKAADVISCGILNEDLGMHSLYRYVSRTLDPNLVNPQLRSHAGIETNGDDAYYTADFVDLDSYDIIISTLGSTPSLRKQCKKTEKIFTHIVVDEAGQAAEMEVWIPVAFFASQGTRLIVAGDPMQLGPVSTIHLLDDPAYGYKNSILTRLYQNEAFRNNKQKMIPLTKNYRSHESIVKVVSQIFYEDKLEFTCPPGHDSLYRWHRLPKQKFPVFFESVYGIVRTDPNGSSSNETEARAVVFYVQSLLRWHVKAHEIGVVSPYTSHTMLIRHLLGPESKVTVDTVEKFQGSERRVIILTAVRNGTALGFMEDRQRLNTAISRAQQLLIVIGHGQSLKALPDWKKFIEYCKKHGAYVKYSDTVEATGNR